jgi:hypothetical protein
LVYLREGAIPVSRAALVGLLLGFGLGFTAKLSTVRPLASPGNPGGAIMTLLVGACFAVMCAKDPSRLWAFFAATFIGIGVSLII